MAAMFQLCNNLEYIVIPNFNTSNVTDMGAMFNGCHKLKEIKGINNFNTINTTKTVDIFSGCNELSVNLSILSKFNAYNLGFNNFNRELKKLNEENKRLQEEMDNIIAINFMSTSQNINFPIACKITDNFKDLEKKLYKDYPELKHKNLYFMVNGNIINRDETLENNGIKNRNAILICENE